MKYIAWQIWSIRRASRTFQEPEYGGSDLMKINLGCGRDLRPGYVNGDIARLPGVDVVFDISKPFLPFADQCMDEVVCNHVAEHVSPLAPLMKEIHRVLKTGGRAVFLVPHFTSNNMFNDPTHKTFFTCGTFDFFTKETTPWPHYFNFSFSRIEHISLLFSQPQLLKLNELLTRMVNANRWRQWAYEASALRALFPAEAVEAVLIK